MAFGCIVAVRMIAPAVGNFTVTGFGRNPIADSRPHGVTLPAVYRIRYRHQTLTRRQHLPIDRKLKPALSRSQCGVKRGVVGSEMEGIEAIHRIHASNVLRVDRTTPGCSGKQADVNSHCGGHRLSVVVK